MKTYVLFHGNCPDGTGAALAAWLKFQDGAEYIPVNYGQLPPSMEPGSDVFIIDFSYSRDTLLGLKRAMRSLVVLDHHATAEKDLAGLDFCTFDMAKSGAVLAWEYFHGSCDGADGNGEVPEFFRYLQDRDLWQFKLPQSREVSMALRSYPMDFRLWSNISAIRVRGNCYEEQVAAIDALKKEGVACKRLTDQQVDNMTKHHRRVRLDGKHHDIVFYPRAEDGEANAFGVVIEPDMWCCPVANATVFFSEVGERLLEINLDAPFSAYYLDRSDGKRQWGLRSRPEFDCSVIAKAFGGGGHKNAAGFIQQL